MRLKAAVVGDPIAHSLSPRMFSFWAAARGKDLDYEALRVAPEAFRETFSRARSAGPWLGWSVTVPHKALAAELADRKDASVEQPGAANVLVFRSGRAVAYNTDAQGFLDALKAAGCDPFGSRAVVFGAGGAAAAVIAALRRSGAAEVVVFNRSVERGAALARRFGLAFGAPDSSSGALASADLVVNATAAGLEGKSPLPAGASFKPGAFAMDLFYRPRETPFMAAARAGGARASGGLGMLVRQGALAWELFFGETLPEDAVTAAEKDLEAVL